MLSGPVEGLFDAAYAVDVLEHIPAEREAQFIRNIVDSLAAHGVLLVGIPSIHS